MNGKQEKTTTTYYEGFPDHYQSKFLEYAQDKTKLYTCLKERYSGLDWENCTLEQFFNFNDEERQNFLTAANAQRNQFFSLNNTDSRDQLLSERDRILLQAIEYKVTKDYIKEFQDIVMPLDISNQKLVLAQQQQILPNLKVVKDRQLLGNLIGYNAKVINTLTDAYKDNITVAKGAHLFNYSNEVLYFNKDGIDLPTKNYPELHEQILSKQAIDNLSERLNTYIQSYKDKNNALTNDLAWEILAQKDNNDIESILKKEHPEIYKAVESKLRSIHSLLIKDPQEAYIKDLNKKIENVCNDPWSWSSITLNTSKDGPAKPEDLPENNPVEQLQKKISAGTQINITALFRNNAITQVGSPYLYEKLHHLLTYANFVNGMKSKTALEPKDGIEDIKQKIHAAVGYLNKKLDSSQEKVIDVLEKDQNSLMNNIAKCIKTIINTLASVLLKTPLRTIQPIAEKQTMKEGAEKLQEKTKSPSEFFKSQLQEVKKTSKNKLEVMSTLSERASNTPK